MANKSRLQGIKAFFRKYRLIILLIFIIDLIIPDPAFAVDEIILALAAAYGWM